MVQHPRAREILLGGAGSNSLSFFSGDFKKSSLVGVCFREGVERAKNPEDDIFDSELSTLEPRLFSSTVKIFSPFVSSVEPLSFL